MLGFGSGDHFLNLAASQTACSIRAAHHPYYGDGCTKYGCGQGRAIVYTVRTPTLGLLNGMVQVPRQPFDGEWDNTGYSKHNTTAL